MKFKEIKIGEAFIHKALVLTLSGIPFFMKPNDIVEIYDEERHDPHKPTT